MDIITALTGTRQSWLNSGITSTLLGQIQLIHKILKHTTQMPTHSGSYCADHRSTHCYKKLVVYTPRLLSSPHARTCATVPPNTGCQTMQDNACCNTLPSSFGYIQRVRASATCGLVSPDNSELAAKAHVAT